MSTPLVEVKNLQRAFGYVRAVRDVSFALHKGQVVGLIGANGAGKTTTMRILATLDQPDAGTVTVGGVDVVQHPEEVRQRIGWMPDHFSAYRDTTVGDYLDFFARANGFKGLKLVDRVMEVMDFTDLTQLASRPMDRLSKGQTQRLCLGRTLLNDPEFLILDEPAAGLDPKARLEFKNLVRILRDQGKTLLISSHILSELGEMCDTLVFMNDGAVVHQGDKDSLLQQNANRQGTLYDVTVHGSPEALIAWLQMRPGWRIVEQKREGVRAMCEQTDPIVIAGELKKMTADLPVLEFRRHERRLEEAFVDMLKETDRQPPLLKKVINQWEESR